MGLGNKPENKGKFNSFGPRGGETRVFDKKGNLLKSFINKFKSALGPEAESVITQENVSIREEQQ